MRNFNICVIGSSEKRIERMRGVFRIIERYRFLILGSLMNIRYIS